MRIIIIGGGAGGASVAARARRQNEHAEILLFDKRSEISQATCGLPYYIGNTITDRSRMTVVSNEDFERLLRVDVRTRTEVTDIYRQENTIAVLDHATGQQYREHYDKLVIATGSVPGVPKISGAHRPNVFSLRSTEDMDAIKHYLDGKKCKKSVVVGGGFIGLEVADNLTNLGIDVTVVEFAPQVMGVLDREMASLVHQHLRQRGVALLLDASVTAISSSSVMLHTGQVVDSDLVILALGTHPQIKLAVQCGLELGDRDGILVNDDMTTVTDKNIYALGESVEINNLETGERTLTQLAGPTQKQASIVADNLFGANKRYRSGAGTAIAKVFDLSVAVTGRSERSLAERGIDYRKSYADLPSHASYYPNAMPLTIKLLFAPETGVVLGAQIVGYDGVDKRIDVLASAIQFGRTVSELAELDLAYAPPYSSAKDPVNVVGMIAKNMIEQDYRVTYWDEFLALDRDRSLILDVRTSEERELDHIEGSLHIPLEELRDRLGELPGDKHIAIYCQLGKKGYFAYRILRQNGYSEISNLSGGYKLLQSVMGRETLETPASMAAQPPMQNDAEVDASSITIEIDATGLSCPGPIMRLTKGIRQINDGELLLITASDPGFDRDVETWCKKTGNSIHSVRRERAVTSMVIRKNLN